MKTKHSLYTILISAGCTGLLFTGCKKFADVPPSSNILTSDALFSNENTLNNALAGLYTNTYVEGSGTYQFNLNICPGNSADELVYNGPNTTYDPFINNGLYPSNTTVKEMWGAFYKTIYLANAIIEGVEKNKALLSAAAVDKATGEALFMRAFAYFYVTNLFGDVPLTLTTNLQANNTISRTPQEQVYQQLIKDLTTVKTLLKPDYSASTTSQRLKPNRYAAAALLARVYLYNNQWKQAEEEASFVLNATSLYNLLPATDIGKVFYKNSKEAIWQMNGSATGSNIYLGWTEIGSYFFYNWVGTIVLSDGLTNAFEPGDIRLSNWTTEIPASETDDDVILLQPAKYKSDFTNTTATAEAFTYLRLAEMYLIRAEARARLNTDISSAKDDLNTIRNRAKLGNTTATTKEELLLAIEQERRVELFSELGHRWFDLKRTGRASTVLSYKQGWKKEAMLYPIPQSERQNNKNLSQNTGY